MCPRTVARIVYTDVDDTMVGRRGSFWHTADGDATAAPAAALLELHHAGVPLVLVSGRTSAQLVEAARLDGLPDVVVTASPMGDGCAEAVRAAVSS